MANTSTLDNVVWGTPSIDSPGLVVVEVAHACCEVVDTMETAGSAEFVGAIVAVVEGEHRCAGRG